MKLSIVDLSPVPPGGTRHDAILNTIDLARHAERLGYQRIWYAEHHGGAAMAGRAPEVLIPMVAASTSHIRLGSGAVLLNHYSPYKVAEIFSSLNEMFPGRIDMGIGRATTGPVTDMALQRDRTVRLGTDDSDQQLLELMAWMENRFPDDHPFATVPIANDGSLPEMWLLGSSSWSASAASQFGLRYAFAGFINQAGTAKILDLYRRNFEPSAGPLGVPEPQMMLSVHVACGATEEEARRLIAPAHIMYRRLAQRDLGLLPTPDDAVRELGALPRIDLESLPGHPPRFIAGTPGQIREKIEQLAGELGVQEIMIQDIITDHQARLRSYELLADVFELAPSAGR